MQLVSADQKNYTKPFMYLIVACGVVVCLLSVFRFPVVKIDLQFLILTAVTIVLGSRIGVEYSSHKIQITVSDTFVFLTLLLYGGEAAVLVAAAEAFCSTCSVFASSCFWYV